MNRSKAKGTFAETAIAAHLRAHGFPFAERRAPSGSNDKGDIAGVPGVLIEAKNCKEMALAGWLDEAKQEAANAGVDLFVVWHKRRGTTDPGEWYVTMTGNVFVRLLEDEQR